MKRLLVLSLGLLLTACSSTGTTTVPTDSSASSSVVIQLDTTTSNESSSLAKGTIATSSSASAQIAWNLEAALKAMPKTREEWKNILSDDQYNILWQAGTEIPFTSPLLNEHRKGTFVTADCGEPVFRSEQKFDSGTGWPSFWAPISPDAVVEKTDTSLGETRTEILSKCGGHLGHVFDDGPAPTGLRYCMNGLALKFIPDAVQ